MRVVLDTNVIVSATLSPSGVTGQILARVRQREDVTLVTSEPLLAELTRVLSYPKLQVLHQLTASQISEAVRGLRSQAHVARDLPDIDVVSDDPDDNMVIACAVAGSVDMIVSGDRHLLGVSSHKGITVISPAAFLLLLSPNTGN